jgi:hypothetical protein
MGDRLEDVAVNPTNRDAHDRRRRDLAKDDLTHMRIEHGVTLFETRPIPSGTNDDGAHAEAAAGPADA